VPLVGIGTISQPLSRQRVFPSPQKQGGGGTLACGWGVGGSPNSDEGHTLWYSLYVRTLWGRGGLLTEIRRQQMYVGFFHKIIFKPCGQRFKEFKLSRLSWIRFRWLRFGLGLSQLWWTQKYVMSQLEYWAPAGDSVWVRYINIQYDSSQNCQKLAAEQPYEARLYYFIVTSPFQHITIHTFFHPKYHS
jgi:hypothetical protein